MSCATTPAKRKRELKRGALAATQLTSSLLFGLFPNDFLTYSFVTLFVLGVALLACGLPARRAAKIDPIIALRAE